MISIKSFVFNAFQENTYLLYDETKNCIVIDPGCYEDFEKREISEYINSNQLKLKYILNTHCHIDHVLGNHYIKTQFKAPLIIPRRDQETFRAVRVYAPIYGFNLYEEAEPDTYIDEGEKINFGNSMLDVLFVPGHAPGHLAFYNKAEKICIGGDVLFRGSIGRTDLPGGDYDTLIDSIRIKLFHLGDSITVYPGHGPETTIGFEKETNPYCSII